MDEWPFHIANPTQKYSRFFPLEHNKFRRKIAFQYPLEKWMESNTIAMEVGRSDYEIINN